MRCLLILMIVPTQLQTWSPVSLFLCITNRGALGVCSNPASCNRGGGGCDEVCARSPNNARASAVGGDCDCTNHCQSTPDLTQNDEIRTSLNAIKFCDCVHIPLSSPAQKRMVAATRAIDTIPLVMSTNELMTYWRAVDFLPANHAVIQQPASQAPSSALSMIATIMLRC